MLQPNTVYHPTGEFIDEGVYGAGHCQLCNHALRYYFGIANENNHHLMVGSDCILKFGVQSPYSHEKYTSQEEIRVDMVRMMLESLANIKAPNFDPRFILTITKDEYIKKGFTPRMLMSIDNIASGFKVTYDPTWFKLTLRKQMHIDQMPLMKAHRNWNKLKLALSPSQLEKYGK